MNATGNDERPLILCANDDGFFARGLRASADALSAFARVIVVAPETEQSAMSHSLTLHRPLRLRRIEEDRYALDGTPADCIYLALHLAETEQIRAVLPRRPDLVVSGINKGINLGQDVFYSGTVAAAREGALRGVPSLAVSCEVKADAAGVFGFEPKWTAALTASIARSIIAHSRASATGAPALLLNLNVPAGPIKGVRATKLGVRLWTESVEARVDPRGRAYYWLGGRGVEHDQVPGTDTEAFDAGIASITALGLDLARHDDPAKHAIAGIIAAAGATAG